MYWSFSDRHEQMCQTFQDIIIIFLIVVAYGYVLVIRFDQKFNLFPHEIDDFICTMYIFL